MAADVVCRRCGAVISRSRLEAHALYWCSAAAELVLPELETTDAGEEEGGDTKAVSRDDILASMMRGGGTSIHAMETLNLPGFPESLRFEKQHAFGPEGTGGALWPAEVVPAK